MGSFPKPLSSPYEYEPEFMKKRGKSEEQEDKEWYLHHLIENHEEKQLLCILDADYQLCRKRDRLFGNTLLHQACQSKSSLKLVNHLLEEWPEACEMIQDPENDCPGPTAKPNYDWLPLHLAVMSGADDVIIRRLLEVYPEAAQKQDTLDSSLPLHQCIKHDTDETVLATLIEAYPKGASVLAGNMELVLHKAIRLAKPSVVKAVLKAFPRGVKQRSFPLDCWTPLEQANDRLKYCGWKKRGVGTPEEAKEIIEAIMMTKKQVDADFKAYVKTIGPSLPVAVAV